MADINVIDRIRTLLEQRGMNISELAAKCGFPVSKMSKILSGDQKITVEDLIAIGYALGTNPASLVSPNMSDVEWSEKETLTLSHLFRKLSNARLKEDVYADLLENELANTMTRYLSLKDSGKTIYSHVRRMRKAEDSNIVPNPRVLITDRREGQLFANQLTIGYWFTDDREYVYLAIHYMKRGVSRATVSPVAIQDMREYFKALSSLGNDAEERMDLGNPDSRIYSAGTIYCRKYNLKAVYIEDQLKADLQRVYDLYLQLLDTATKRVQETYENMYQSRREIERKERPENNSGSFDKSDLDRIMPVAHAPKGSYAVRMRGKDRAFAREDYKCEIDSTHITFVDRSTGKNYMEGHFLIPYIAQPDYKISLENAANICCVCPTCKKKLERASDVERQEMLMQLYLKHKDILKEAGLEITPMQLFKFYGMS